MCRKVLIVEDSRAFRNYLVQQLSALGCEPLVAQSLFEAKQMLNQHPQLLCAILNYRLPDAQDGEAIDLLLSHQQRAIVLTATFDESIRERCLAKGVLDYILKQSHSAVSYLIPLVQRLVDNTAHHALVVDDSAIIRHHVCQLLERQYIRTTQAEHGQQALTLLRQHPDISIVITDNDMPVCDGISMINEIRRDYDKHKLAILGLSGSNNKAITARFLKAGANDFLHKPFNQEELYCRVHHLLDAQEASQALYQAANQDPLTGLWNRRYFFSQPVSQASCAGNIAMLDIDFFKSVNDSYGHDGGDVVLRNVANILKIYFPDAVVARFGGEEFCIQFNGEYQEFITRLDHMRVRIQNTPATHANEQIGTTVSIGACCSGFEPEQQLKIADQRLYIAKQSGRNQIIAH